VLIPRLKKKKSEKAARKVKDDLTSYAISYNGNVALME